MITIPEGIKNAAPTVAKLPTEPTPDDTNGYYTEL